MDAFDLLMESGDHLSPDEVDELVAEGWQPPHEMKRLTPVKKEPNEKTNRQTANAETLC